MREHTETKTTKLLRAVIVLAAMAAVVLFLGVRQAQAKTTSKVEKAIAWAIDAANDPATGYSMTNRWGPDYDCGSFVTSAFRNAGFGLSGFTNVTSMRSVYTREGFTWIDWDDLGATGSHSVPLLLKRGDILVDQDRHTELYIGDGMDVAAHQTYGHPETGDQTGKEVSVSAFYNNYGGVSWDGILRYTGNTSSGTASKPQENTQPVVTNKLAKLTVSSRTYDGKAVKQPVKVYGKNGERVSSSSYTLTYSGDLTNAGKVTVTAKGKNGYRGSVKSSYSIRKRSGAGASIASIKARPYTGRLITPSPTVKVDGKKLKRNQDYQLSAVNNKTKGTLTVKFIGNYTGSAAKNFSISKIKLSSVKPKLKEKKFVYTGEKVEPELAIGSLSEGTDYSVKYTNNLDAGKASMTLKGKTMVSGSAKISFTISRRPIGKVSVDDATYTGEPLLAEIHYEDPKTTARTDYNNNVNAGTGSVTIVGYGNYSGKVTQTFRIQPRDIGECQIEGVQDEYLYTGSNVSQDLLDVKYNGQDATYKLKYGNRSSIGKKTFSIIGTGNFNGKVTESFRIRPGVPEKLRLTPMAAAMKVSWAKLAGGVKYQFGIRQTGTKTWKYVKTSKTGATVTGLNRKKNYVVKIRAYRGSVYGEWSETVMKRTK
ncbi:peptidoglycan amidohydrolase family protein [Eubacterium pyruvativorans]|uniref:peptidoglycan amidohydrolase family protein n=1 Tax=Eubacterium pyruvativorans TaxID=155865 RepID=UPI0013D6D1EE|nr:peptidoglycan amidohydrolase family protein [Eubacterium pyruvativorans]